MLAIISETLNGRLEFNALISRDPLLNEGAHDDSSAIELVRVPVEALVLIWDLNIPQVV